MITTTGVRVPFVPNGVTTTFPFDFLVLAAADLLVKLYAADGSELPLPTYSVTGVGNDAGGSVVFDSAPVAVAGSEGWIERTTDATAQGAKPQDFIQEAAADRERRQDQVLALAQEAVARLGRTIQQHPLEAAGQLVLPPPSLRAGKALLFDALGLPIVGSAFNPGTLIVSAFIETLLAAIDAAAARGTLGVPGLDVNNAFTGANAFTLSPTGPTPAAGDTTTKFATMAALQAAVGRVNLRIFASSSTYVPSAGMVNALGFAQGAGGGGGGRAGTAANVAAGGGGGGAGGFSIGLFTAAQIGASKSVTISTGGAAGNATGTAGGTGGPASLGTLLVANGGLGGDGNGNGGNGGPVGTGSILGTGAPGQPVPSFTSTANAAIGGNGGSSWLGNGGRGPVTGTSGSGTAAGLGGGGAGGASNNASGGAPGTAGGNAFLFILEFCNQ